VISSAAPGKYEVEVVAIDALGNRSVATNSQQTVNRGGSGALDGLGTSIEAVEGAAATALSATIALLTWTPPKTAGLKVAIRHTPSATGGTWDTGNPVTTESPLAAAGQIQVPALSGYYLLRFVNDSGTGSFIVAAAPFNQSPTLPFTYAANYLESASTFAGAKSNCYYDESIGALRVNRDGSGNIPVDTRRIDDFAGDWDSLTGNMDSYSIDGKTAIYYFNDQLDLGAPEDVELIRTIKSYSVGTPALWDSITGNIDDATFDFEGKFNDAGEVSVEYSASPEALSATTKWSEWAPLTHCYALLRSLRLRARLTIGDVNQDLAVTELGAAVLLPQQVRVSATLTTSAAALAVTFASAFYSTPSVNVTAFDLQTGDYFQITLLTASGFTITFRNAAGTAVARNFQYQAVGFGSRFTLEASLLPLPDPSYSSIGLLLQFGGANDSTIFTDSGPLALSATVSGNAKISKTGGAFSRFSNGNCGLFTGDGNCLVFPSASVPRFTGDFTVETIAYPTDINDRSVGSSSHSSDSNVQLFRMFSNGSMIIYMNTGGVDYGTIITAPAGSVVANQHQHLALCRSGSNTRLFAGGNQVGPTNTGWTGAFTCNVIGQHFFNGNPWNSTNPAPFAGRLNEFRTTSVARYTANFTPPSAPFADF
jgi:hypothetical protein